MLKIKHLSIEGVNGISKLSLNFHQGFNFICGGNGIGKTTILDCIASSFNRNTRTVRRNVQFDQGNWSIFGENKNGEFYENFYVNDNDLTNKSRYKNTIRSKEIINFSINRTSYNNIFYGNQLEMIQQWFLKNYYEEKRLSEKKYYNLMVAQKCFTMLDPKIYFSTVKERKRIYENNIERTFADIYLETPSGKIPLNYLSSGYRSCLSMLLGIIKKTEVTGAYNDVHSFDGVILIDELDLHLHPEWQGKLISILKWLVPNAQIIAATHSPHIIQVAQPDEVIPLGFMENGIKINKGILYKEYGFQGWTIEEVLRDVMGLENTHSKFFTNALSEFDESLSKLDVEKTMSLYNKIDKMLHPQNHLRKILKIQMASLGEITND
ncbi:AAA family ATPase [Neobacillus sp. LXY-4]|uniref:AAA family ATPase n=1 Tax=Neobacillus sp. LXY-4 TaxID=3379826 RepID=UPI003EDE85AA